jgi:large subunit ribosomal protein L10
MPSRKNIAAVATLKEVLANSTVVIGTSFAGLGAAAMTDLRRALREKGVQYRVVKNTVTSVAADEAGRPEIKELLQGPTGLVLGYGDAVEAAQALNDYLRASRIAMTVHGVVIGRQRLGADGVTTLAGLPPRAVLAAQFVGQLMGVMARLVFTMNAPAQRLVSSLNGPGRGLVTVMQRRVEQVEGAGA